MRVSDVFYSAALVILLGWLIMGSIIDAAYPGGSPTNQNTASHLPAVSASSGQLQPLATATFDERNFWVFVGGRPDVWSVAISADD
jgi:hypothetical protein